MSAEFESPVSSLGESVFRNLRNAVVRFNGGEGVDAIFRNLTQPSLLGQAGAWVRIPELICLSADVADVEPQDARDERDADEHEQHARGHYASPTSLARHHVAIRPAASEGLRATPCPPTPTTCSSETITSTSRTARAALSIG